MLPGHPARGRVRNGHERAAGAGGKEDGGGHRTAPTPAGPLPEHRRPLWRAHPIGTPIADFEPRPAAGPSYRPDSLADGWSTDRFCVRLASVRGYAHRLRGTPRQDDAAVVHHAPTGSIVLAIADGVSAAPFSHIGATAACRAAVAAIVADLDTGIDAVDWQNVVRQTAWQLTEQARTIFKLPEADPARAERELATTLVTGLIRPTAEGAEAALIQVGDSSAWVLRGGEYRCLLEAKFSIDDEVLGSTVTALPRVPQVTPRVGPLVPGDVLLVGTDGFGDPLGDGSGLVGRHLADQLGRPQPPLEFAYHLDFSRETFDDDRTLLAVWTAGPEAKQ
ncbi:protein phosphatase 2C domain-containing protein [Micromonospora sp. WMMA2032]|uniref:protein phosphatase 2C domain-containing protein n=1 Tax=Micromonospora sp. WMMA2032 TaxID=2039870 RepID=UPI0012FD0A54|nr:protein phosphatase 2C domain-containing protein [Micromonospora sp. WMMA2032]